MPFKISKSNYCRCIYLSLLFLFLFLSSGGVASAQQSGGGTSSSGGSGGGGSSNLDEDTPNDATRTGAFDVREDYRRANKLSIPFGPPTPRNPDGMDEIKNRESVGPGEVDHGPGPVYTWPVLIPKATSAVPTRRDMGIMKHRLQTFGLPISDTQYQMIHRMDQQIMLEEMFDPERIMWLGACIGTSQVQDTSNSFANVIRNQCASAIDYVSCYISNFTVEKDNRWNKIRDQLFMPMAILLLLPGAMLAQVKVIVAAGMPIGGADTSPFEGIVRSIVAIFLIPATYLVVNYSVDINNSLTLTISQEYERIFSSNMYKDALCFIIRAFPIRQSHENRNGIYKEVVPWDEGKKDGTPAAGLEGRSLKVKVEDPCAQEFHTDPNRADEQAPFLSVGQRFVTNSSNAVLAMTWNILCAFQVVFFMYLWLVGPVVAALWVYPHETLRGALPGWVEGVITLAFWALFWNTVVLLMACFKGVDETGSIMASALLFLSIQSVKSAFDFAGLVKAAGDQVAGAAAGAASHFGGQAKPNIAGGPGAHKGGSHAGGKVGAAHGGAGGGSKGGSHAAASSHGSLASTHGAGTLGALAGGSGGAAAHASLSVSGTVSAAGGGVHGGTGLSGSSGGLGTTGLSGTGGERGLSSESIVSATSSGFSSLQSSGGIDAANSSVGRGIDINTSNSLSSISANQSNFTSFNSNTLEGSVHGLHGTYSAQDAARLIGQENLANFPREGAVMDRQQALNNFTQAVREVDARNGREGMTPESQQRNDLLAGWKSLLEDASKQPSADGQTIGIPNSLSGTAASSNWEIQASQNGGIVAQGFSSVAQNVNEALDKANMLMATGATVNPQAVEGLTNLAREMSNVGPQLAGMAPQQIGTTMEAWQQKADVLSRELNQPAPAGYTPSADSYMSMSNNAQQAQAALASTQQYYTSTYGSVDSVPQSGGTFSNATYSPSGADYGGPQNYGSGGGGMLQSGYYPDQNAGQNQGYAYPQQQPYPQQDQSFYGQPQGQYSSQQQQPYPQQDQSFYGQAQGPYSNQQQPQPQQDQSFYGQPQGPYSNQQQPQPQQDQSFYGQPQGQYSNQQQQPQPQQDQSSYGQPQGQGQYSQPDPYGSYGQGGSSGYSPYNDAQAQGGGQVNNQPSQPDPYSGYGQGGGQSGTQYQNTDGSSSYQNQQPAQPQNYASGENQQRASQGPQPQQQHFSTPSLPAPGHLARQSSGQPQDKQPADRSQQQQTPSQKEEPRHKEDAVKFTPNVQRKPVMSPEEAEKKRKEEEEERKKKQGPPPLGGP